MTNSSATYNRSVVCDLPDYASQSITFKLLSYFAAAGNEGFPIKIYTLTLGVDGTGTQVLPVPDNTGDAAWLWEITTPDDEKYIATLNYNASSIQLTAWLSAALSTATPNSLTDTFVLKDGDTMSGQLNFSGTDHAGLKLLSLTTAERDALTPAEGMAIYNETLTAVQVYQNSDWVSIGAGGVAWGAVTGTLSDQTDLQSALDDKLDDSDVGVTVQGYTAKTAAIAALSWAADSIIQLTGTGTAAVLNLASHVLTFLGSANAAAARSAIGAGTGSGDVTAASNITDNAIVRGDGGAKGVQTSGVTIDDNGKMDFLASSVIYGNVAASASKISLTGITPGTAFRPVHISGTEIVYLFNDVTYGKRAKYTSVGASPQTVIPNGGGDVTAVISGTFTIQGSAGNVAGGVITATAPSGSFNLYTDGGTNVCQLQVAADGSVTVVRTAGTRTYTIVLDLNWI